MSVGLRLSTVLLLLVASFAPTGAAAEGFERLARCLAESGSLFYGAYWCPYCQKQIQAFGSAARLLPYVECSEAGSRTKRAECREAGVSGYPTWVMPGGVMVRGVQRPEVLAALSGCESALPR